MILAWFLGRGVTVLKSDGGYGEKQSFSGSKVLFCVIPDWKWPYADREIDKMSFAFVIQYPIRDTKGGMIEATLQLIL